MQKIYKFACVSAVVALLGALCTSCSKEYIDQPVLEQGGSIAGVVRYCPEDTYKDVTNLPLFPLDSTKVVLVDAAGTRIDSMFTNREGVISFINLKAGQYSVQLSHRRTTNKLTLKAEVTGKQITYLNSDGFDCINFQLAPTRKKKWTFIHLGNNSHSANAPGSFQEVRLHEKSGGSGAELNNVAFFDCGLGNSQLIYIVDPDFIPDPDPNVEGGLGAKPVLHSPAYVYNRDHGDYNISGDLGDYKFVQKKIKQIADLYPSDSVAIFIYGHGSGIDETPGFNTRSISPNLNTRKEITIPQLSEMLTALRVDGVNIGILLTNACFMNMFEVGYELKDTGVKYYLAAPTMGAGLLDIHKPFDFISHFKDGTGTSYEMGVEICKKPRTTVLTLCNLSKIGRMTELYNDFATKVNQTPIHYIQPIIPKTTKMERKGYTSDLSFNCYDLGDFALQITQTEFVDTYNLKPSARALYNYIKDPTGYVTAMGRLVVDSWTERMTGVSTLLVTPGNAYENQEQVYRNTRYYKDGHTEWDSFLRKINWINPEMEEWNGSVSQPTQMTADEIWINIPSELAWVAQQVNSGIQNFSGKKIILKKDIDLGGRKMQQWIPIGTATNPFKGTFDGGTSIIYRLYINSSELNNAGLFGYISDAAINACQIEDSSITVTEGSANAGANICVGALCGTAVTVSTQSSIAKCFTHASIKVSANDALLNVGGLVGDVKGTFNIINDESLCSISVDSKSKKMVAAGGLFGNCAGGTLGQVNINSCLFLNAQLFITSEGDAAGGGMVGCNENSNLKILHVENSSLVNVRAKTYAYAGGLIGNSTKPVTLIMGNNIATITASVATPGEYSRAYAGGLIGAASAKIYACSSSAAIVCNDLNGLLAGELEGGEVAYCNLLGTDSWAIAGRITSGQRVTAKNTYYNSTKGLVGQGTLDKQNCVPFSATAWPTDQMPGWGPHTPEEVGAADWNNPWKHLGAWNNGKPYYPEMKSFALDE